MKYSIVKRKQYSSIKDFYIMLYIHVTVYKINCLIFLHATYVDIMEIWRGCKQTFFLHNGFHSFTLEKGNTSNHPLDDNDTSTRTESPKEEMVVSESEAWLAKVILHWHAFVNRST